MNKKIKIALLVLLPAIMFATLYLSRWLPAVFSRGHTDYPGMAPSRITANSTGRLWTATAGVTMFDGEKTDDLASQVRKG